MRNVLILTYDFPPRGATGVIRVTKFARYLPQFGWQPVVVTAAGASVAEDSALLRELPDDLEVIRVADPLTPLRRGQLSPQQAYAAPSSPSTKQSRSSSPLAAVRQNLRRLAIPDPQIMWLPSAVRAATERIKRGDISALLTTSPPHSMQLGGLWIKRRFPDLPWIMDLRDLWSESSNIHDPMTYKLNKAYEHACLRTADRVVVVTETMRHMYRQEAIITNERIVKITNGFDGENIPPITSVSPNETLELVYVGTLTSNRAPSVRGLFKAMQRLVTRGVDHTLIVRCYGFYEEQVYRWAAPLIQRGMVELRPFVPHAEALAAVAAADVLLLVVSDDREGQTAVPNKLYEYLATGKPLLALTPPGEVTNLIERYGSGMALRPGDVDAIAAALEQLIEQHRAGTLPRSYPNHPRLQRFERRELTRRLAALLDETVT